MKKFNKLTILGGSLLLSFSAFALLSKVNVKAGANDDMFAMTSGASIKVNADGLRFQVKFGQNIKNQIENDGDLKFIVAPAKFLDDVTGGNYMSLYNETESLSKCVLIDVALDSIYETDDVWAANGCLTNLANGFEGMDFFATAILGGDTYADIESVDAMIRSQYEVVNSYFFENEGEVPSVYSWYGNDSFPIEVTNETQYETLKTLTLTDKHVDFKNVEVNLEDFPSLDTNNVEISTYSVSFKNGDTLLDTLSVEYGKSATYSKTTPTKDADADYTYTFDNWYDESLTNLVDLSSITSEVTVYAKFTSTPIDYDATINYPDSTNEIVSFNVTNKSTKLAEIIAKLPADDATYTYEWVETPETLPSSNCSFTIDRRIILNASNLKSSIFATSSAALFNENVKYALTADIDASSINWEGSGIWSNGFAGNIDGKGHTIKNINLNANTNGIFNATKNATIKNINFEVSSFVPHNNTSVFGILTEDSTFEDVSIKFNTTFTATAGGIISGNNAVRNTYKNVSVDATGSNIKYLVCQSSYGDTSSYNNVTCKADTIEYIYGTTSSVTNISVTGYTLTYLTAAQAIDLSKSSKSINVSSYFDTIDSITCGSADFGKDPSNLTIASDFALRGESNIVVKGVKSSNMVAISLPVIFADEAISTFERFKELTMSVGGADLGDGKYYVLASDIDAASQSVSDYANNTKATAFTSYGNGFKGTVNGLGYAINNLQYKSGDVNSYRVQGIFGGLCNATIKNLTLNLSTFGGDNGNFAIFGWNIKQSTLEDITINIPRFASYTLVKAGFLANQQCDGTFKNITVNAPGTTINNFFGTGGQAAVASCTNVVINCAKVNYLYSSSATSKSGVTINELVNVASGNTFTITKGSGSFDVDASVLSDGETLQWANWDGKNWGAYGAGTATMEFDSAKAIKFIEINISLDYISYTQVSLKYLNGEGNMVSYPNLTVRYISGFNYPWFELPVDISTSKIELTFTSNTGGQPYCIGEIEVLA